MRRTVLAMSFVAFGFGGVLGVSSALAQTQTETETAISFRLDWSLYGVHAPFFLAAKQGYFADEGLNVTISEGQGSATVMQLVAQGGDQFGLIDYSTLLYGIAEGLPITAVGRVVSDMMGVISPVDAPIKSPQELVGKIIAYAPSESTGIALAALLANQGVDIKQINILNPAVGAKNALFLQRRADAIPANVNVQPAQLEEQGAEVYVFKYSDFGLSFMAQGLTVNNAFSQSNPDAVRGFVKAAMKGLEDSKNDPAAAVDALIEVHPEQERNRATLLKQLEISLEGLETANTSGQPLGTMDTRDWEAMQNVLVQYGGLKQATPLDQIFTNEYLPE